MAFLQKLWDETLAGPPPEKGLGRLRKYNSFSAVRSPDHSVAAADFRDHHGVDDQTVPVSRRISILRTKNLSVDPGSGSEPASPTPCNGPPSPFSPGGTGKDPDRDVKRFTRSKTTSDAFQHAEATATSPTVYDWIMISALDR